MSNLAEKRKYTYRDYALWDEKLRYELIDGVAYAMATPSQAHQEALGELHFRLKRFLQGKPCKVFVAPFSVRLNADSFDDVVVEPDIFIVCDKSKLNGKSVKGAPDFIIEILSPSTTLHDTVFKARLYRKSGVREYWIVNPYAKTVQVCILENGRYIISDYDSNDIIPVHILEGCQINLAEVFYDIIESEPDYVEITIKRKFIEALKENGMSDKQIEKIIDSVRN